MHEETVIFPIKTRMKRKGQMTKDDEQYFYVRNHQQEQNNVSEEIQARSSSPALMPCQHLKYYGM